MTSKVGRPRDSALGETFLQIAERLMREEGFSGLSVDRIVREAGSTRPTFYRRFAGVGEIAFVVVQQAFPRAADPSLGSLDADVLRIQRENIAVLASPLVRPSIAGLLESARVDDASRARCVAVIVQPVRTQLARAVEAARARDELISASPAMDVALDLLLGPLAARLLLPWPSPVEDDFARRTADAAVQVLRAGV